MPKIEYLHAESIENNGDRRKTLHTPKNYKLINTVPYKICYGLSKKNCRNTLHLESLAAGVQLYIIM